MALLFRRSTSIQVSTRARGTSTGAVAYARTHLPQAQSEVYYRIWFNILSQGSNEIYLLRVLPTARANAPALVSLYVDRRGLLGYRSAASGTTITSMHRVTTEIMARSADPRTCRWFETAWLKCGLMASAVKELSITQDIGTEAVGQVELGESRADRTFDVAFDDVIVSTSFTPAYARIRSPAGFYVFMPMLGR